MVANFRGLALAERLILSIPQHPFDIKIYPNMNISENISSGANLSYTIEAVNRKGESIPANLFVEVN